MIVYNTGCIARDVRPQLPHKFDHRKTVVGNARPKLPEIYLERLRGMFNLERCIFWDYAKSCLRSSKCHLNIEHGFDVVGIGEQCSDASIRE
jgi:hypothetical protein